MTRLRSALAAAAIALSLSGCVTTDPTLPPSQNPLVNQVIQNTISLCKWQPTFTTVAKIIASIANVGGGFVDVADFAARTICNAVTAHGGRRGAPRVVAINGQVITINGRFVR